MKHGIHSPRLFVDFIASVPWDFIALRITHNQLERRASFVIGGLRSLRLLFVMKGFQDAEQDVRTPYMVVRIFKFLLLYAMDAHWFACIFYFVAITESDPTKTWLHAVEQSKPDGLPASAAGRYLVSLYWGLSTLATVGYGDVTPQSSPEMAVTVLFMLFNLFLCAWVLGNMTILITQADESTRQFRDKFQRLERYMALHLLPEELQGSLRSCLLLQFSAAQEHRDVLDHFPAVLRTRVQRLLYRPAIDASLFSAVGSDAFLDSLSCVLQLEVLMAGTQAVTQNEASFEMFLVVSGSAELQLCDPSRGAEEVEDEEDDWPSAHGPGPQDSAGYRPAGLSGDDSELSASRPILRRRLSGLGLASLVGGSTKGARPQADKQPERFLVRCLEKGDCFGEVAFFYNLLQPFTVSTSSICRLLVLKREHWDMLRAVYPADVTLVQHDVARELNLAAKEFLEGPGREGLSGSGDRSESERDQLSGRDGLPTDRRSVALREVYSLLVEAVSSCLVNLEQDKVAELCAAASSGNLFALRQLTHSGLLDVNCSDYDSRTALHVAAAKGQLGSARLLLGRGAAVDCRDCFGVTPLFEAVRNGHDEVAELLFAQGASLGLRGDQAGHSHRLTDAGSLMCQVVASADEAYLARLLRFGLSPHCRDYDGRTGLHLAAAAGRCEVLQVLLAGGAKPSPLDHFGRTPLLEAVRAQHEPAARILHRAGGRFRFVLFRQPAGASPEEEGEDGGEGSPPASHRLLAGLELCQAAFQRDLPYLRLLLQFGCPPDAADYDLRTAAHIALAENCLPAALALLEGGADFLSDRVRDRWGRTPFEEGLRCGHHSLASSIKALADLGRAD